MEKTISKKETITIAANIFDDPKKAKEHAYKQTLKNNQSYYVIESEDKDTNRLQYNVVDDRNYARLKVFCSVGLTVLASYSR